LSLDPPPDGTPETARASGPPCPLCHRQDSPAEAAIGLPAGLVALVAANTPGWRPEYGLCAECAQRFQTALDTLSAH